MTHEQAWSWQPLENHFLDEKRFKWKTPVALLRYTYCWTVDTATLYGVHCKSAPPGFLKELRFSLIAAMHARKTTKHPSEINASITRYSRVPKRFNSETLLGIAEHRTRKITWQLKGSMPDRKRNKIQYWRHRQVGCQGQCRVTDPHINSTLLTQTPRHCH